MAELNKTDVKSKTFTLELDTGQKKSIPIVDSRGRETGEFRSEPITVRVPKMSTVSSYDVAEDGTVSNVNSVVRQVVTKDQYDKLEPSNRSTEQVGSGQGQRTEYYAHLQQEMGKRTNIRTPMPLIKYL